MWFEVSLLANRCDWEESGEVQELLEKVKTAVMVYKEHNNGEDEYLLPLTDGNRAISKLWQSGHSDHNLRLDQMVPQVEKIQWTRHPDERRSQGIQFCWNLSDFLTDDLKHMHFEETTVQNTINSLNTPDEISTAERTLILNANPEFVKMITPFYLLSNDARTVAFFCRCVKAQFDESNAPPTAWSDFLNVAISLLGEQGFQKAASFFPEMEDEPRKKAIFPL